MRILTVISFIASLALYISQIFFYTKNEEILVYGIFGVLWYMAMYTYIVNENFRVTFIGIFIVSGLAASGLGFVPHRLRLGSGFDIYAVFFPIFHFLTTLTFLWAKQKPS